MNIGEMICGNSGRVSGYIAEADFDFNNVVILPARDAAYVTDYA